MVGAMVSFFFVFWCKKFCQILFDLKKYFYFILFEKDDFLKTLNMGMK
jgi:hypothetical protein